MVLSNTSGRGFIVSDLNNVLNDREEEYGSAFVNFEKTGQIWGALLDIDSIPGWQVALMMDSFKTVRCFANPNHIDSWIDKLGYTTHGKEIVEEFEQGY